MNVTLTHDVRFKRNANLAMSMGSIKEVKQAPGVKEAYRISHLQSYTMHLDLVDEGCDNDTYVFKLVKEPEQATCCEAEEHKEVQGKPRLRLSTKSMEMTASEFGQELQVGGHWEHLTFSLSLNDSTGCDTCDVFWLQVDYYSCRGFHGVRYVPLVMEHDDDDD
jgi:hypothetical protein